MKNKKNNKSQIKGNYSSSLPTPASAYSSWGAVHGSGSSYTRMALRRSPPESASSSGGSSSHSTRQDPSRNPAFPRFRDDRKEEQHGDENRERGFIRGCLRGGFRGGNRGGPKRGPGCSSYY